MESKQEGEGFQKMYEKIINEKYGNEYRPNSLETYERFKERKKAGLEQRNLDWLDKIFEGLMLLVALDDNQRTKDLLNKFFTLDTNPALQDSDLEALTTTMEHQKVFELTDEDYSRLLDIADNMADKNRNEVAVRMYQALVFLFPGALEVWLKWGNIEYEHFFDYKKVLAIYERCLEIFDNPAVYAAMGVCHIRGKEFEHAEESFTKAIERCDKYDDQELKEIAAGMISDLKELKNMKS